MKPMIFQVDQAFRQLNNHGRVVSARGSPREEGEDVWIRKSRTGPKEFDAEIWEIEKVEWTDKKNLIGHLADRDLISGFGSHLDWYQSLKKMHDEIPNPVYFHYVCKPDNHPYRDINRKTGDSE